MTLKNAITVVLIVLQLQYASGSAGDGSPFFRECQNECVNKFDCPMSDFAFGWTQKTCFDCRQTCIWITVALFHRHGHNTPQFFGKWPFYSISLSFLQYSIVIQEPASALFSVLNLAGCLYMFNTLRDKLWNLPGLYNLRLQWLMYAGLGSLVWIFSTAFHCRDFWLTEYLDYAAASALVFYAFYMSIMLVFGFIRRNYYLSSATGLAVFYSYSRLVNHLSLSHKFDYGYNMRVCILVSFTTAALYLFYIYWEYTNARNRESLKILLQILLISLGSSAFELLDFPPILYHQIDAHSLFHLATVPTPFMLTRFALLEDEYRRNRQRLHEKNL
ncbi:unnamed protein product [Bursaphelenchus okinawaensis]|uniref:Post-GPI attachment to proteins factor 3 n=1 Tax=Bursaphelenchus okinawaensis TaxID=465554 RepID=A0A811LFS5_9BILA|nr:unnamed protein product [Bursaphelenchus okinawaensis]CAG9122125.1 unnamed protein product [Bursaphelenchus okinawaensis]